MGHLKTTWHHARRSPYQAFAAVFIMMQTFFMISIFSFVIYGSARLIAHFESLPQVIAFFKNETKQAEIDTLGEQLKASGKVSSLKFVSKKEALRIYREQNKDDPLLLDLVSESILPPSFNIAANKIEDLAIISAQLKQSPYVEKVIFPKDVISTLTQYTSALRKIGFALVVVLALDAIFIMVIIIGIKISQRREEIEIMRLIGATSWYIRWPFLYEGVLYGVVGAVIGWTLSVLTLLYVTPFLTSFLRGIPIFPFSPVFLLQILSAELLLATLLGAFSSYLAVLRYLK